MNSLCSIMKTMNELYKITRRDFIKKSGMVSAGGIFLGIQFSGEDSKPKFGAKKANTLFTPNVYINIASTGIVTLFAHRSEMGTGIRTSLPLIIADELEADWTNELKNLGWSQFFIKDFVKSLKTSVGSMIERPEDIHLVAAEMEKYRGQIEGGLCIRRVEDFLPQTEQRYFVLKGKPYASDSEAEIPPIVSECAARIESQFFSVEVVSRTDGMLRIVEIGDGQVSDLVGWSPEPFVKIWDAVN